MAESARHTTAVAVTGIGVVSPIGIGKTAFLDALKAGRRGFKPIDLFDTSRFQGKYYAPVNLDEAPEGALPEQAETWDRHVRMAYIAAAEALADAGCRPDDAGTGLVAATCSGGMLSIEQHYRIMNGRANGAYSEAFFKAERYFGMEWILSETLGIPGYTVTVVTACSAGANAIGLARDLIVSGNARRMIVVGADAFAPSTFAGFDCLKTTSPSVCAPFSLPMGLNLGEAACAWVIERAEDARRRGAGIYAFLPGYGLSCDAYHPTSPDPSGEGAVLAMERALRCARIERESIGYINAHGTGTPANDKVESKAVTRVFGDHPPPVSSTKSYFGHTLGAAGIIEATASILMLREHLLPPTLNFTTPRDACHLDYVPNTPRKTNTHLFISNSFAFAGNNCSLVVSVADGGGENVPSMETRVVITGYGIVAPGGGNGGSGGASIRFAGYSGGDHRGLHFVKCDLDILKRSERRLVVPGFDTATILALAATRIALERSDMRINRKTGRDMGLILGLTFGPGTGETAHLQSIMRNGLHQPSLKHFPYIVLNSVQGNVSRALHLKGFSSTLCSVAGAGLDAFLYGVEAVRSGHSDALIAGGADEINDHILEDLALVRESGGMFVPVSRAVSEGAVMAVLERRERAEDRSAAVLAEVLAGRAFRLAGSDPAAAVAGMLQRAGVSPADVNRLFADIPGDERSGRCLREGLADMFGVAPDELVRPEKVFPGTAFAAGAPAALLRCLHRCGPGEILLYVASTGWGKVYAVLLRRE